MNKQYTLLIYDQTFHDGSAVLMDNNHIMCILETERISKHKHSMFESSEEHLVDYIQKQYNIEKDSINVVNVNNIGGIIKHQHHELHALASYLSSGYDKTAILVVDGMGDQNDCITLFAGRKNQIYELKKYPEYCSLGALYGVAAGTIYKTSNSEGKLMGLSCYAEPEYSIPSPIQFHEDGTFECVYYNPDSKDDYDTQLSDYITDNFAYLKIKNNSSTDIYKAKIAATVQWWFTEQMKQLVKYLKSLLPQCDNLCLGGGCFLNCETNGIIDRMGLFKNIYCNSAPADNSIVLGAAQQLLLNNCNTAQPIATPYWGPSYNKTYTELEKIFGPVEMMLRPNGISEYSEQKIIDKLKNNTIIIWFDGGSEFGPRALGHRSFLASPTLNQTFWDLSVQIKGRENYRPLAPITTDELYEEIFEDPNPQNLTNFMLKTVKIKKEWINKIPAVVHADQTARPQRLTKDINPELYSLITNWHKQTGIPCLINTSLNLKGQPILETFDDLKNLIMYGNFINLDVCAVVNHSMCLDLRIIKSDFAK